MLGLSFGSTSAPQESAYHPYDTVYEREEADIALRTAPGGSPTPSDEVLGLEFGVETNGEKERQIPQQYLSYDRNFEQKIAGAVTFRGNGRYFLSRDWLMVNGVEVTLDARRPLLLYTHPHDEPFGAECRNAHEHHAFVALVYLLRNADVGSTVFLSMPYFTDLHVLDELCHFARPQEDGGGRGLTINVILTETKENLDYVNKFIGNSAERQDAILRLGLRSTPQRPGHCHTKAVVSTAGMMTGSYSFTTAARKYNREHGMIVGSDHQDNNALRQQLETIWEGAQPMVRKAAARSAGDKKRSRDET